MDNRVDGLNATIGGLWEVDSFPFRRPHGKTFCAPIISKLFVLTYSLGIHSSGSPQNYAIYKKGIFLVLGVPLCVSQGFELQATVTNFSQLIQRHSSLK